jgi:trans-aconitate 2-methyltransferase
MWSPAQYLKFGAARMAPARDLMARLPGGPSAYAHIVDLGCGTGEQAAALAARFPSAATVGVDSSAEMLARARVGWPGGTFVQQDIASWLRSGGGGAGGGARLLYSNAALQWLPSHGELFPSLAAALGSAGVLAVQMPRNHAAPAYAALSALASAPHWRGWLPRLEAAPVAPPEEYYAWLAPHFDAVDVWETEYLHVLEGEDPVVEWVRGLLLLLLLLRLLRLLRLLPLLLLRVYARN